MAKSVLPYVVEGASDALDNPNINLLFSIVSLKLIYPSGSLFGGGGGSGGSGVNSYIDLENRPDDIIDTTVSPATTTGGEFTSNNDNYNALDNPNINLLCSIVSLKLIYPSPLILSVEKVPLPPHALLVLIVVRVLPLSVRFTNALLSLSLLGVNSPPIYLSVGVVQIYENGGFKGSYTSSLIDGGIYKVQRTGNTITYLVNDVVFHTSATTSCKNINIYGKVYTTICCTGCVRRS
jgi:hypothetical protein